MDKQIILGLGCNLGNREQSLNQAVGMIEQRLLDNVIRSSIYKNPPMLPENAPADWDIDFYNVIIAGRLKNKMTPQAFLAELKNMEGELGRKPSIRWSPREMDIDIIAWGNEIINDENLQIPHYGLHERDFVIIPLAEILPDWKHPIYNITASEYAAGLK